MSFFLTTIKKDIARWRQDRTAILLWIGIPFLIGGLMTALFDGEDGGKPHGILLVADQDDSLLSGFISGVYSQGELGELISVEKVSVQSGTERINAGDASGFLIIPEGFGQAFINSSPVTLTLKTNPSQTILPGIIIDVTEIVLDAGFYAERLFGDEIEMIKGIDAGSGPDDLQVAAIAVAIQHKIDSAGLHIFPPAIDLTVVEPPAENPTVSIAVLFLPGVILMAVMFAANGLAGDFWKEREYGTLRRLVYAPGRLPGFVIGKAIAAGIFIAPIAGLVLVIGFSYHDIAWSKLPSTLIWVSVSGVALFAWFGALNMIATNKSAASLITSLILLPMLMAGGSFFPFAALPDWIASFGRRTPNGFVVDQLATEITATAAWAIDLQSWLIMLAMTLSGLGFCAWRLQNGFARA